MIDKALVETFFTVCGEIYEARAMCVSRRETAHRREEIHECRLLIERQGETDFDAAVIRLGQALRQPPNFRYTGPWPPYNFVNIADVETRARRELSEPCF